MAHSILGQVVAGGLLIGLVYALVAAGLTLIFGLMDVVNFAHGEFLMVGMYATLGLHHFLRLDPVLVMPFTAVVMFGFGAVVYRACITRALKARTNVWMSQIFVTFGLALVLRGLAQFVFTPDYRSISDGYLTDRNLHVGGVHLPMAQVVAGAVCLLAFVGLYLLIAKTTFGRALEATREDREAVGLLGIDRHKIFAWGWGLGSMAVGIAAAMLANFYYIHPGVGESFILAAFVVVALGGFGSIFGALLGGLALGLVEALTAFFFEPSLKYIGMYALYLVVVFLRPKGLFGYH